jgi:succinate dehydrogenase/fumarate reductase flavoprotein subunit
LEIEKKKCDVLCVGGGIAGLMAAIQACEEGAKVIVADKSNTLRSGSAGMGNDHFQCYIPEVHGDFDFFWKELFYGQLVDILRKMGQEYVRFWFENTFDIVKLWDKWGIPMKYEGKYEFAGHGFPGKQLNHLKFSGMNQKPVLTKQALDRGAEIVNRVMVFDLLKGRDGSIAGAIGINTREDKLVVFEAGAVILGTGCCSGIYPSVSVGADNNRGHPISLSGDGRAMAYRAGVGLRNPELNRRHAGPKYLCRFGQATWVGVLRDRFGRPAGPYLTEPSRRYHDMAIEVNKGIFEEYKKSGRGPIYMDMNGISKADLEYMIHWLGNEGNSGMVQGLLDEGLDLSKTAVEFQTSDLLVEAGVMANHRGETALKGLYAAGDEVWNTISHAAVFGRSAGENAAKYVKNAKRANVDENKSEIEEKKAKLEEIRNRKDGPHWQEANSALQQIMMDYCGLLRSEALLGAGIDIIKRLKKKAQDGLMAENAHDLMLCLQVLNKIDIGELILTGAFDRRETRELHVRSDYTLTDPLLGVKNHVIRQVNGQPVAEWIDIEARK